MDLTRRQFLKSTAVAGAAVAIPKAAGAFDSPAISVPDRWLEKLGLAGIKRAVWGVDVELPREICIPGPFNNNYSETFTVRVKDETHEVHWFRAAILCGTWWKSTDRATCRGRLYGEELERFLKILTVPNPHHLLWAGMVAQCAPILKSAENPVPVTEKMECHQQGWTEQCAEIDYTHYVLTTRYHLQRFSLGRIYVPSAWSATDIPLPPDSGHSPMGWLPRVTTRIRREQKVEPRWLIDRASRMAEEFDNLYKEYERPSLAFGMYVNPRAVALKAFEQDLLLQAGSLISAGGSKLVRALERTGNKHALRVVEAYRAGIATRG